MTKLNRKVEYALVALKHMRDKRPGELSSAKEISDAYQTPFDATARVLQILSQAGWLHVEHGVNGGYLLRRDLAKCPFLDLLELILGPMGIVKCMHESSLCELHATCNITSPIAVLNSRLMDFYASISLAELLDSSRSGRNTKGNKVIKREERDHEQLSS